MKNKKESIEELKRWIDVATISPIYPLQSGLYKGGYRFSLDSKKLFDLITCPKCGRQSLVPYVDNLYGMILDERTGWCQHRKSCGYHRPPREFLKENPDYFLNDFFTYKRNKSKSFL